MRLVLMGAPGAGKGTQADVMAKKLFVPHISTGDIFRAAIKAGTEMGKLAEQYISQGKLVPDEVTLGIVKDRLEEADCKDGFILDGFPRTIAQADGLQEYLASVDRPLDSVINIDVDLNSLVDRLTGRRVCRGCGASFHLMYNPPAKEGVCDECGGELYQRKDDSEETIKNRLNVYVENSKPLIDYYAEKGLLMEVDGNQAINEVLTAIGKNLGKDW
ncbi:MAG: adenylate kinase [Bacillota bacterium]